MRLGIFTKLYLMLAMATLLLIWLVIVVSGYFESRYSLIADEDKITLRAYAEQASVYINNNQIDELQRWITEIKNAENTLVAVLKPTPHWLTAGEEKKMFDGIVDMTIGRELDYPIHLDMVQNPFMKVPIPNTQYNLMIQLPQRMRPGTYWQELNAAIRLGFPIFLVALICIVIYRYIVVPLKSMQKATYQISLGDFDVRLDNSIVNRQDELGELCRSFNTMAHRIGMLVGRQKQLIEDISHELRTPITRIKLVLAGAERNSVMDRVEQEVDGMQTLLEDTLTLSGLNNENTQLVEERVDLSLLIDSICEDAAFEFSRNDIVQDIPDSCIIHNSNHRAIGQAVENILRNAIKYTKYGTKIKISIKNVVDDQDRSLVKIIISDWGCGVKEEYLEEIFEPFFRADTARDKTTSGYGLGLALAKRQIEAVRGNIYAHHNKPSGLCFIITLPLV